MKRKMQAGTYYLGDPCYCFDDSWMKILEDTEFFDGPEEKQNIEGHEIAVAGTAHGDGVYRDNDLNSYAVDAGLIGLLPIELLTLDSVLTYNKEENLLYDKEEVFPFAQVFTFENDFSIQFEDGIFDIFSEKYIKINTREDEDEETYLYEDDYRHDYDY